MNPILKRAGLGVRWWGLGLVAGLLSCLMAESRIIYLAREQKTLDHIVWPGIVFGLVVLLPMSRWAGDRWLRTAVALIASSAVYPIAWRLAAVSTIRQSAPFTIMSFALAGFLGSCVLASVFLPGRPGWAKAASVTVILGTAVGGLMGANLAAALATAHWPLGARDGMGLFLILWQAVVGGSLGLGVMAGSSHLTETESATKAS